MVGLLLPYMWAGASLPFRFKQFGSPDLRQPRAQADELTEGGHRAVGAQMNAWEALAVFSAANLIAFMAGVDPAGTWATLAMVWVAVRVLHGVFYIASIPPLRIACFAGGLVSSLWIVSLAITS